MRRVQIVAFKVGESFLDRYVKNIILSNGREGRRMQQSSQQAGATRAGWSDIAT